MKTTQTTELIIFSPDFTVKLVQQIISFEANVCDVVSRNRFRVAGLLTSARNCVAPHCMGKQLRFQSTCCSQLKPLVWRIFQTSQPISLTSFWSRRQNNVGCGPNLPSHISSTQYIHVNIALMHTRPVPTRLQNGGKSTPSRRFPNKAVLRVVFLLNNFPLSYADTPEDNHVQTIN